VPQSSGGPISPSGPDAETADEGPKISAPVPTGTARHRDDGTEAELRGRPTRRPLDSEKFVERGALGSGGSSVVVRALDKELLREVAVKILSSEFFDGSPEAEQFIEEARITGQLEHPNIVPIYEIGVRPSGQRFLCLRLLEGQTLEATLDRMGEARLQPDNLANLLTALVKVCDAVAFAHSRGVLHRDLKPLNIMLSDFGQVYVLDWGIARLIAERSDVKPSVRLSADDAGRHEREPHGGLMGTPAYMPPEQIQGRHDTLDERTDVFALGATLYQILVGSPPMSPDSVRAIWMRRPPPPIVAPVKALPGVPPELSRIAMRALSFDVAERYPTVSDFKADIERFQRGAWHLPRHSYLAGAVIVSEGEPGTAAYVIEDGQCIAYRVEDGVEIELRVMGPGEVFGETAVFTDKPRTASVKARTDVVLLAVTSEVLSQAVGLNSWMGAFVKALADRFREADERLRVLERRSRSAP
jgi:serine/threonine-protein kinase